MFKSTSAKNPEEYISLLSEPRKSEIQKIHNFIKKTIPNLKPYIIAGMIGYGIYHYTYATGRKGVWSVVALASQKNYISIYVSCTLNGKYIPEEYKDKLPKASIGKSCIRFKKLEHIDFDILKEILHIAAKADNQFQKS